MSLSILIILFVGILTYRLLSKVLQLVFFYKWFMLWFNLANNWNWVNCISIHQITDEGMVILVFSSFLIYMTGAIYWECSNYYCKCGKKFNMFLRKKYKCKCGKTHTKKDGYLS